MLGSELAIALSVLAAEVGGSVVLALVDDRAPDRAGAREAIV
jgi:hypothetical protein